MTQDNRIDLFLLGELIAAIRGNQPDLLGLTFRWGLGPERASGG